jgi:hypothetical protein
MSIREQQFLECYQEYRYNHQREFYRSRIEEFETARNQAIVLTSVLIGCAGISSLLATANVLGWRTGWVLLAVIFPTLATALTAYERLYSFERVAKLYRDAVRALPRTQEYKPASPEGMIPDDYSKAIKAFVQEVETISRNEGGQWGQLMSEIRPAEPPGEGPAQKPSASRE